MNNNIENNAGMAFIDPWTKKTTSSCHVVVEGKLGMGMSATSSNEVKGGNITIIGEAMSEEVVEHMINAGTNEHNSFMKVMNLARRKRN